MEPTYLYGVMLRAKDQQDQMFTEMAREREAAEGFARQQEQEIAQLRRYVTRLGDDAEAYRAQRDAYLVQLDALKTQLTEERQVRAALIRVCRWYDETMNKETV
jgi:septal ring factor EnvC (AmiA/AmiB activator)